jgi:hypothetical protein
VVPEAVLAQPAPDAQPTDTTPPGTVIPTPSSTSTSPPPLPKDDGSGTILAIPKDAPEREIRAIVKCLGDQEERWRDDEGAYLFTDMAACFISLTRPDSALEQPVEIRLKGGDATIIKLQPFTKAFY